jgi:hypothetical protein
MGEDRLENRDEPRVKIPHKSNRYFTVRDQIAYCGVVAARIYVKTVERKIYKEKQQTKNNGRNKPMTADKSKQRIFFWLFLGDQVLHFKDPFGF